MKIKVTHNGLWAEKLDELEKKVKKVFKKARKEEEEIWVNPEYVDRIGFSQGVENTTRTYEEEQKRLLDKGEIDMLTYLDNISKEEDNV